ncbi:SDR family NAD(P)-dependent oxidoreductase [Pseudonocardia parietis]|uniref:NAD(P)-dependent dehydrogenase (Short-subunit alcohol dehydrogenase family) n=1 Tax=Pseudonocardia parietis TaxID=570936 RepID=A0ABS4VZY2_9PSEU|nr:SDR family oxidoreductase [Pseudonocardia parietis]MBP2369469.1 NAD(P)-dependent dehydrogenase (short-subunit alcohol dehydrogenase family) [Pseudonocardia parietis]
MTAPAPAELFDLTGRTAVVTGASSGLGVRFAGVLAAAGATVFVAARRAAKLAEIAADDDRLHPVVADVSEETDRTALIDAAVAGGSGSIDVLVNNAGVESGAKPADETPAGFAGVLNTNLVAPFHLAQLAARHPGPDGLSIVNISSVLGLVSAAPLGGASYASSKAGLVGLTRELAGHWGRSGIRVNALAPGWFRTEMNEDLFADERSVRWIERNTMLRRPGSPPELDTALLFLASPASTYVTGQVLAVDGGWTAR